MAARDIIQAAAGAAGATEAVYVENVFSTYLYTGTGASQTINNGIDLATKGGLVWIKCRQADGHKLFDTVRGAQNRISSSSTVAQASDTALTSFTSTGYVDQANWFTSNTVASWTFRKQPKFFDVVTYTGTGSARTIAHSLGATPGMIIVKGTSASNSWTVYHKSLNIASGGSLYLNSTAAQDLDPTNWNSTAPTSTVFSLGSGATNTNGVSYIAYLFADSNSGGFGPAGTDSVVACGSFTGNTTVNLGWEPQLLIVKRTDTTGNWQIIDNMRGMPVIADFLGSQQVLFANTSGSESISGIASPNSTGFNPVSSVGTYIYLAIRRGPMKTPTDATKVFAPVTVTAASSPYTITTGFAVDTSIISPRTGFSGYIHDRLRGGYLGYYSFLDTTATAAEVSSTTSGQGVSFQNNTGLDLQNWWYSNSNISWNFRRAPGFFDVVCYTGTGSAMTISHNLGVVPEMIITKRRSGGTGGWYVYHVFTGANKYLGLDITNAASTYNQYYTTTPTSTNFAHGVDPEVTGSGSTYVAYLFATCPGVSKVGSYTGTGTTKQIDCGFSSGARFVLIKRTNSTGSWYVWDTARGLVSGNDPYLLLNSTAAEVTNTDYIDPYSAGFEISSTAPAEINASGGTYIYLAIA